MKLTNIFIKISIRVGIFSAIFAYCLFAIMLMFVGNAARCERLESNYVTCQQYKTSLALITTGVAARLSFPINPNDHLFSYQLKGTEIANNNLYLLTSNEPILYINGIDDWAIEYPIERIESFIRNKGNAKIDLHLQNSSATFILHLSISLLLGAFILGSSYYLDNKFVAKLSK